jgi:hypothetical protein
MRTQEMFCPTYFGFRWTADGWYEFPRKEAHAAARKARNARVKELRKEGWTVTTFNLQSQLRTLGGIGSGHPEIEVIVNVYGLNATKPEPEFCGSCERRGWTHCVCS